MSGTGVQDVEREVLTPGVRRGLRRWLGWISLGVVGVLVILATLLLSRGAQSGTPFDPESSAPNGTRALVEVLRDRGVDVRITDSLEDTRDAALAAADTTLLLDESQVSLDYGAHLELRDLADRIVLMTPDYFALGDFAVAAAPAGQVEGGTEIDADCDVPAVQAAGRVLADGTSYRINGAATGCLESDDDAFGLVQSEGGGRTVTVLGLRDAFTNEHIGLDGNAALGLHLLGGAERLIWYTPGYDDLPPTAADPSILQPRFQAALALLAGLLFVAAAVWRGRRFGPLVIERLPVTVPTSETMDGRARLYQRASARLRALDALRIGTVSRLATATGLPRTASVGEVIDAVAAVLGHDRAPLAALLVDADPQTDDELVRLSDQLLLLERDVRAATTGR